MKKTIRNPMLIKVFMRNNEDFFLKVAGVLTFFKIQQADNSIKINILQTLSLDT